MKELPLSEEKENLFWIPTMIIRSDLMAYIARESAMTWEITQTLLLHRCALMIFRNLQWINNHILASESAAESDIPIHCVNNHPLLYRAGVQKSVKWCFLKSPVNLIYHATSCEICFVMTYSGQVSEHPLIVSFAQILLSNHCLLLRNWSLHCKQFIVVRWEYFKSMKAQHTIEQRLACENIVLILQIVF